MYQSIGDYISKILTRKKENEILIGDLHVEVAESSARDHVAAVIHVWSGEQESADFIIYKDGREEYQEE